MGNTDTKFSSAPGASNSSSRSPVHMYYTQQMSDEERSRHGISSSEHYNSPNDHPAPPPGGAYQAALHDPMGPPIKSGSYAPGGRPALAPEQRSVIFKKTGKKKTKSRFQLLKSTADKTKQEHFPDGKIIHMDEFVAAVKEKTGEVVRKAQNIGSGNNSSSYVDSAGGYSGHQTGLSMNNRNRSSKQQQQQYRNHNNDTRGQNEEEEEDVEDSIDLEAEVRAHAEAEAHVGSYSYSSRYRQQGHSASAAGGGGGGLGVAVSPPTTGGGGGRIYRGNTEDDNEDEDDWVDVTLFDPNAIAK